MVGRRGWLRPLSAGLVSHVVPHAGAVRGDAPASAAAMDMPGGVQATNLRTVEIEDGPEPACIAEAVLRYPS